MQRARQHLLAGARFAQQQDGGHRRRHPFDQPAELEHARIAREQAIERRVTGLTRPQLPVLAFEIGQAKGPVDHGAEQFRFERLGKEVGGAERHGLQGIVAVVLPGKDDDLGRGREREDFLQGGKPFACAVGIRRQPEIQRRHRRFVAPQRSQCLFPVRGEHDLIAVERPAQLLLQPRIVFDHQQDGTLVGHSASRRTRCDGRRIDALR